MVTQLQCSISAAVRVSDIKFVRITTPFYSVAIFVYWSSILLGIVWPAYVKNFMCISTLLFNKHHQLKLKIWVYFLRLLPEYLITAKKVVLVHSLPTGPYGLLYG